MNRPAEQRSRILTKPLSREEWDKIWRDYYKWERGLVRGAHRWHHELKIERLVEAALRARGKVNK